MNERIELLAEQCGFRANPDVYDRYQSFDIPRFAELIVRECAAVCDQYGMPDGTSETARILSAAILGRFGVK